MNIKKLISVLKETPVVDLSAKAKKFKINKEKEQKRQDNFDRIKKIEEKFGVDFSGYIPDTADLGTNSNICNGYESAYPMPEVFKYLNIKEGDTLLDIGSGKGYAMYMFSEFSFSKIHGVELSENLAEISIDNLGKIFPESQDRFHIFCENALEFDKLDDYNYIFMYNPFPREVVGEFVDKLAESVKRRNDKLTVIYQNPQKGSLFEQSGVFDTVLRVDGTAVFESK